MRRGWGASEDHPGRIGEIDDRRLKRVRWRGGIRGITLLIGLVATGACSGEPSSRPREDGKTGSAAEDQRGASRIEIRMTDDMRFEPENPIVAVGDTIVWINVGVMPHTATDEPGRAGVPENNILPAGAATWDSGLLSAKGEYRTVVDTPGEYTYLCTLHEVLGMVGHLTVR